MVALQGQALTYCQAQSNKLTMAGCMVQTVFSTYVFSTIQPAVNRVKNITATASAYHHNTKQSTAVADCLTFDPFKPYLAYPEAYNYIERTRHSSRTALFCLLLTYWKARRGYIDGFTTDPGKVTASGCMVRERSIDRTGSSKPNRMSL